MWTAVDLYSYAQTFRESYSVVMKPLCDELGMTQTAVDILMFLANNPGKDTSTDIRAFLRLKPGIVSFHVDRLVNEGYLERGIVSSDRRKFHLICTQKAIPFITKGRKLQEEFQRRMFEGFGDGDIGRFAGALNAIEKNMNRIIEEAKETLI